MENKFTRFTAEQNDKKIVWEVPYDDITGDDCMEAIRTLMIGLTFLPTTVIRSMKDYVNDNSDLLNDE